MFQNKRGDHKNILLISVGAVIILIFIALIYIYATTGKTPIEVIGSTVEKIVDVVTGNNSPEKDSPTTISSTSSSSGSGGGGGGGSSGGGSSIVIPDGCNAELITYSMVNLRESSTCNEYDGEICINNTVMCSRDIQNREKESEGNFEVQLNFIYRGDGSSQQIDSFTKKFTLGPQETETFNESTTIISSGEEGLANQIITCFFNTLGEPYKIVC